MIGPFRSDKVTALRKLGALNHLRLTVSDVDRAAPFYLPVMAFLGYRLEERKPGRIAWEAPPGVSRNGSF